LQLATRSSQINVEAANDVDPCSIISIQVRRGDLWVGVVWACILTFVWLQDKIRVGKCCYEVVGSCEVQQVMRCNFLVYCNLIKTCMCVCVWSTTATATGKPRLHTIEMYASAITR